MTPQMRASSFWKSDIGRLLFVWTLKHDARCFSGEVIDIGDFCPFAGALDCDVAFGFQRGQIAQDAAGAESAFLRDMLDAHLDTVAVEVDRLSDHAEQTVGKRVEVAVKSDELRDAAGG